MVLGGRGRKGMREGCIKGRTRRGLTRKNIDYAADGGAFASVSSSSNSFSDGVSVHKTRSLHLLPLPIRTSFRIDGEADQSSTWDISKALGPQEDQDLKSPQDVIAIQSMKLKQVRVVVLFA